MSTVLAALDTNTTAERVLAVAHRMGKAFGLPVEALHVLARGGRIPESLAAVGVPLRVAYGTVVDRLVEAGSSADVRVLVIGARGNLDDPRPLGTTAVGVATAVDKPIVVVPPGADTHAALSRVLVPLEGTRLTSLAPRSLIELGPDAAYEVVALHVLEPDSLPAVTDQPQHEQSVWAREFLARYCPWGIGSVRLVTRVGRTAELVPAAAHECGCDLIVLGWSRELHRGRARVVRTVLEQSPLPVLLVPVPPEPRTAPEVGAVRGRARR
jgi:nucleotide-binding universal stress UspA family protein